MTRLAIALAFLLVATPAWGQTPTLVQHYYTGTNSPVRGLTATNYAFRLPNKTLSGNCLVMFLDYPSDVSVSSITDDGGNAWPAAAVTADGGSGNAKTSVFVLPNVAAGTRVITVTFGSAVAGIHAVFLEYYNVATSSPVGSSRSSINTTHTGIASGTLSPSPAVSGNLVLHYAIDNNGVAGGQNAANVTGWTAGSGWTMLGGDINSAHDASPFALQARLGDGTNFNPTMTATQSGSDTFNAIAVEIKAASAGTAPAAGIRIIKQQFYVSTALSVPGSWTEFFPAQGNLLVAANVLGGSTTSAITDSNNNMWTLAQNDPGYPAIQYAQNPTTDSTLRVTVPLTNINSNTTIALWDITGAATSGVLAQSAVVADGAASNVSSFNNAPSITPVNQNGLILVVLAIGQGPMTGFASGAPASALFMPVTYPGETDFDTFDNADGYAHNYYGTSLAQQNYNWTLIPKASNSYQVSAVEFKADDTTPTTAPSGLTATAVSTSQINLAWTAATDSVGVTGYLVERCQGSGCTAFGQVASVAGTTCSDVGLAAATSYSYRVRATDATGNLSGFSNTATATTPAPPDTTPPTAPSGLTATAASTSRINLAWTAATDNVGVTGYLVERCQGSGCTAFGQVASVAGTTYSDAGVAAATSYSYRVRATDATGNLSGFSNTATAATPAAPDTTPPTAPWGLTATAASTSQINLAWTAATDNVGVTGYFVERCQGSKCTAFAQVARVTTTTYSNSALAAATSYRYRVRATDAAGNLSGFSKTASATTLGSPPPSTGPIAFLQGNYATPQAPTASVMVAYRAAQSAGDLNAVIVGWNDTTAAVIAVTDTMGNAYTLAVGPTVQPGAAGGGGLTQAIYYAKNILGAAANANTVTVRFSVAATYPDVRILEYSGLDRTNPLDVTAAAAGNSSTSDSGAVTTTNSNDLLVGGNMVWTITAGPGIGFTSRMITSPDGDIAEDQVVTSTGSYRATAPLSGAGPWVMQLVTFRAAGP